MAHVASVTKHLSEGLDERSAYGLGEAVYVQKMGAKAMQVLDSMAEAYAALVQAAVEGQFGGLEAAYRLLPRTCMAQKLVDLGEGDVAELVYQKVGSGL